MDRDWDWLSDAGEEEPDETDYARGRLVGRTYVSRSFALNRPGSADHGQPSRFVYKVFDPESESEIRREPAMSSSFGYSACQRPGLPPTSRTSSACDSPRCQRSWSS
jgi:hypothetical protein